MMMIDVAFYAPCYSSLIKVDKETEGLIDCIVVLDHQVIVSHLESLSTTASS